MSLGWAVYSICKASDSLTDFTLGQPNDEPTKRLCEGVQRLPNFYVELRALWYHQDVLHGIERRSCVSLLSTDPIQVHQILLPRLYRDLICRMKPMDRSNGLPSVPRIEPIVLASSLLTSVHPQNKQIADQCCSYALHQRSND